MNIERSKLRVAFAGIAVLWLIVALSMPQAMSADANTVEIKNFMFAPTSLTVKAGTAITWTNHDDEPHTVVSDTGLFRSGAIDTDETFSFKFERPGTYHFTCSIHPRMIGTIVVQ